MFKRRQVGTRPKRKSCWIDRRSGSRAIPQPLVVFSHSLALPQPVGIPPPFPLRCSLSKIFPPPRDRSRSFIWDHLARTSDTRLDSRHTDTTVQS